MPDVSSTAPVGTWVAIDQRKLARGRDGAGERRHARGRSVGEHRAGDPPVVEKLGGPEGLAVCYEAGPRGYQLYRLLTRLGVACDVIAPSLITIRAGDRVKTGRRDAKKLVRLYRAGELVFVQPPSSSA